MLSRSSRPLRERRLALGMLLLVLLGALSACSGPSDKADARDPLPTATDAGSLLRAASPTAPEPPSATAEQAPPTATATAPAPIASPTATDGATALANGPTPTISAIDQADFTKQVDELVDAVGGTTEVVVGLADGTVIYDHNGAESMESASLYKLGIMVELYRQRDAGLISFDDGVYMYPGYLAEGEDVYSWADVGSTVSVGDLLQNMITLSSNVAATALLDFAGTDNINNTLASLGLTGTEIRWSPGHDLPADSATDDSDTSTDPAAQPDDTSAPTDEVPDESVEPVGRAGGIVLTAAGARQPRAIQRPFADARADASLNVTTAEDVTSLFEQLLRGEVVDAQASQEMLDLLAQQQINDRLPVLLPADTVVAHKTGNLDGLVHDAGVIYAPAGPIVVSVLTEDVDEDVADNMIAQIALLAYQIAS